jgi:transcriptional regulator with XRE-family HTH domain
MQGVVVSSREELTALIGANIRLARRLAGMSQNDVVQAQTGILARGERAFVLKELSGWENARHRPSDHYLARIAVITEQPLSFFFESHDDD